MTFTTSRRPTFAWHLPRDVSGARLEVCADRACSHVEDAADVTGESYRPSTPLAAGVHYWRLRGTAGGRLSSVFSSTWLFRSPATESTYDTAWATIRDVDGDGGDDDFSGGDLVLSATGRRWRPETWLNDRADNEHSITRLWVAGDLDGDGYGDLLGVSVTALLPDRFARVYGAAWYRGGPDGPRSTRWTTLTTVRAVFQHAQVSYLDVVPLGDVEGDGGADVALRSQEGAANPVLLHFAFSSEAFAARAAGSVQNSTLAGLGDIDGDGRSDVLRQRLPYQPVVFPNDPIPTSRIDVRASPDTFAPLPACGTGPAILEAASVSVADHDGDGLADLTLLDLRRSSLARYFGTPAGFRADRCVLTP